MKDKLEILKKKENEMRLIIIFLMVLFVMFLYFSYEMKINAFISYQKIITYIVILVVTIISCISTIYIYQKEKIKPENAFLIVGTIFCLLMCFAMPMTKGHDEPVHGYRIYEYVSGKLVNNGVSVKLNKGIIEALENKQKYEDICFNKDAYDTQTPLVNYEYRMSSYSPISYLPHIIGIYVAKGFTTNAMIQLYIARLCNMICCMSMLYWAIRIIPFGKNMLFLISLIPIAVEGYVTLSADGIAIASSILLISYVLKLKYDEKIELTYKQLTMITILSIIVAIAKTIYLPMVLLLLIIPKEKFKGNKKILTCSTIFIISAIIDFLWYKYGMKTSFSTAVNTGWKIIYTHPIEYIQKIIYTIVSRFDIYLNEIFGGKLEYNEAVSISIFPYILLIATVLISKKGKTTDKFNITMFEKIVMLTIILSIIVLVFTAMFTGWSRTDINYIQGVQGRYLLPILPLIILMLAKNFLEDEHTTRYITMFITIMQIFVIAKIFIFHI